MDAHTLERLEFDRIRHLLAGYVNCALGRRMALKLKPATQVELIERWLAQFREMTEASATIGLPPFGGVHDISEAVRAAVPPHCLEPEEFAVVAETLDATHAIAQWAGALPEESTSLRALSANIGDFKALGDVVHRVVDTNGEIRDDASAKLHSLRTEIAAARINIGHVVDRLLRDRQITRWLRYPEATFHDDRLVLPLAAEHRGRIPGIIHRSSDSGATLFVEPAEAVELNNRIITLRNEEQAEISRLLLHLTRQVYLNQQPILDTLQALAVLDLVVAKVRFARDYGLSCPRLSPDGKLALHGARHPLLVEMQREAADQPEDRQTRGQREHREAADQPEQHQVVPINVRLGDDFDVLVVTGPNTGGKTVTLKTVGLTCVMAQSGLPIPAEEGSCVPVYKDIFIDVGDEQSLQQSLSTFSSHMRQLMVMLERARPGTLVLIDELGAGTDPDEGAAIGQAIVEELLARQCPALVTTHLGVLKSLAYTEPRAENACVEFDEKSFRPTYRLLIGEPGTSNAINIAQRLGLPSKIVAAARGHLSQSHQQLTRAIRGTLQSRRLAEQARAEAESVKRQADQEKLAAQRERQALREQEKQFHQWVETVSALRPGDRVHVKRFDRQGRIVRMLLHKQLAVVNMGAIEVEVPLRELACLPEEETGT